MSGTTIAPQELLFAQRNSDRVRLNSERLEMPKKKTELQRATGKLISAIQKEWGNELGQNNAEFSENVMNAAHSLLQASTVDEIKKLLGSMTVRQYLGDVWVQKHPSVKLAIVEVEKALSKYG